MHCSIFFQEKRKVDNKVRYVELGAQYFLVVCALCRIFFTLANGLQFVE